MRTFVEKLSISSNLIVIVCFSLPEILKITSSKGLSEKTVKQLEEELWEKAREKQGEVENFLYIEIKMMQYVLKFFTANYT